MACLPSAAPRVVEETELSVKPRWRVDQQTTQVLEQAFSTTPYPDREQRIVLATTLNATDRQIQVWFQNRRQRERRVSKESFGEDAPRQMKRPLKAIDDNAGKVAQGVLSAPLDGSSPVASSLSNPTTFVAPSAPADTTRGSTFDCSHAFAPPKKVQHLPSHRAFSVDSALGLQLGGRTFPYGHGIDGGRMMHQQAGAVLHGRALSCDAPILAEVELFDELQDILPDSDTSDAGAAEAAARPRAGYRAGGLGVSSSVGPTGAPVAFQYGTPAALAPAASAERQEHEHGAAAAEEVVQVITGSEAPYPIMWASRAWLNLCGFEAREVVGQTLSVIQGPLTLRSAVEKIMSATGAGGPTSVSLMNHTKSGAPFSHTLRIEPLRDSAGELRCFQASSTNIKQLPSASDNALAASLTGQASQVPPVFSSMLASAFSTAFSSAFSSAMLGQKSSALPHVPSTPAAAMVGALSQLPPVPAPAPSTRALAPIPALRDANAAAREALAAAPSMAIELQRPYSPAPLPPLTPLHSNADARFHTDSASLAVKGLGRVVSELQICEMLDLFES